MLGAVDAFTPAIDLAAAIRSKEVSPVAVGTHLEQTLPWKDRRPALAN